MKLLPWLLLLLFLGGCRMKTSVPGEIVRGAENGKGEAALEISENVHNFGNLIAGEMAVHTFVFRNKGSRSLVVRKAETGCNCLTVKPSGKTIHPGENGSVEVIFNSSGMHGMEFHSFRLTFDVENVVLDLAVAAEVRNENLELKQ